MLIVAHVAQADTLYHERDAEPLPLSAFAFTTGYLSFAALAAASSLSSVASEREKMCVVSR